MATLNMSSGSKFVAVAGFRLADQSSNLDVFTEQPPRGDTFRILQRVGSAILSGG
jgi:hypothetical protein